MHPTSRPVPAVPPQAACALRENHHLWRNGRRWWIAIVLCDDRGRRRRIRRSLGTTDLVAARRRRDELIAGVLRSLHWRPAGPCAAANPHAAAAGRGVKMGAIVTRWPRDAA